MGSQYIPVRSHTLQAIHLMLFVHKAIEPIISNVSSAAIACGMANKLGNKGGVGISFDIAKTRMLIINSHLSAHQDKTDERNFQVWKILNDLPAMLSMSGESGDDKINKKALDTENEQERISPDGDVDNEKSGVDDSNNGINEGMLDGVNKIEKYYDCLIFMGDMNYRINGNRKVIDKLLAADMYDVLISNDQLNISFNTNKLPKFLKEKQVTFRPTYKFDKGCDVYDTSAKKRIPSWTDRILFAEDNLTCLNYNSVPEIRISDHRPVYASFLTKLYAHEDHVKVDDKIEYTSESQVCTIM